MRLTTFTDYSLRTLIYLASLPGSRARIADVATAFEVPENHLVKVVHALGKGGWLNNVRGHGGGMELASPAESIRVGSVVRATEGEAMLAECFGDSAGQCAIAHACRLRGVFNEALTAFYSVLDRYTLADLVTNRHQLARILFVEKPASRAAR